MNGIKPLNWIKLLLLFGIPTLLNLIACKIILPFLNEQRGFTIELAYFTSVGIFVLMPMFIAAIYLSAREINSNSIKEILGRMRIKKLSGNDLIWVVFGFLFLSLSSFVIAKIFLPIFDMDATPFFFKNMPLNENNFSLIYFWPFFFFFNIFGEEFYWRGYIQPRQEILNKKWTWLVHGLLWAFWHFPMGLDLIYTAIPILLILPAIVQITKNTSIVIVIHFVFGAFGFLSLAFGFVH